MLVNRKYRGKSGDEVAGNGCEEWYGDTYQNGVQPGPKKLAQFREIMELTGTPRLYVQEAKGDEALVHVKLFVSVLLTPARQSTGTCGRVAACKIQQVLVRIGQPRNAPKFSPPITGAT